MKTHKSTKLLALLLSALMVITSVPFMAFASPANVEHLSNLQTAISNYETAMKGETVYANMEEAYKQYINAKKVYDSASYGGSYSNVDVKAAYDSLNAAMTVWNGTDIKYNSVKWNGQSGGNNDTFSATNSKKVLWAAPFDLTDDFIINFNDRQWVYIYYADTVMCYDGNEDDVYPTFPVMCASIGDRGKSNGVFNTWYNYFNFYLRSVYTSNGAADAPYRVWKPEVTEGLYSDSGGVGVKPNEQVAGMGWTGGGTDNKSTNYADNFNTYAYNFILGTYDVNNDQRNSVPDHTNRTRFSSAVQMTRTDYAKYWDKVNIPWGAAVRYSYKSSSNQEGTATDYRLENQSAPDNTYVINYKTVKDAIAAGKDKVQAAFADTAKLQSVDQMSNLMAVIDNATKFNPSDYDYSNPASAVPTVGGYIQTIETNINNASASVGVTDKYADLKTALRNAENKQNDGTSYTASTAGALNTAVESAYKHFASTANLYNNTDAENLTNALNAAINALDPLADFTALDEAIAKIKGIEDGKYTFKSVNDANDAYDKALADYAMENASRTDTGTRKGEQAKINAEAAAINEAYKMLEGPEDEVYTAIRDEIDKAYNNTDKYVAETLKEKLDAIDIADYTKDVTFSGKEQPVKALVTDGYDQAVLEAFGESLHRYKVTYDNGEVAVVNQNREDNTFTYGEIVTLPSDNNYMMTVRAAATDEEFDARYVAGGTKIAVRGNTVLTPCASSADSNCVTFKSSSGIVFNTVAATNDKINLSEVDIPVSSGFIVAGFKVNGKTYPAETGEIDLDGAREVIVFLKPNTAEGTVYTIKLPGEEKAQEYVFNTEIKLTNDDTDNKVFAKKLADGSYYPLSTEAEYVFYAAENIEIELVDKSQVDMDKKQAYASSEPIILGKSLMFVGSQLNQNVVSRGFVLDTTGKHNEKLTLANVDGSKGIYNLSVGHTCDQSKNQYTFTVGFSSPAQLNYVAYVILDDGTIKYSDVITAFEGK